MEIGQKYTFFSSLVTVYEKEMENSERNRRRHLLEFSITLFDSRHGNWYVKQSDDSEWINSKRLFADHGDEYGGSY